VGVVTSAASCDRFRGLLAEELLVGIDATSRVELNDHLETCADCRAEVDGLARAAGALAWVDPAGSEELGRPEVPTADAGPSRSLDMAVAEILAQRPEDADLEKRLPDPRLRHRALVAVVAMAAAVLLVLGGVSLSHPSGPETRSVALSGSGGAHATAVLTAESWGTSVTLTQPAARWSQVLTVSMAGRYGSPWNAGSYTVTTSRGVTVTLACALPIDQIKMIAVTDSTGRTVMRGRITPYTDS